MDALKSFKVWLTALVIGLFTLTAPVSALAQDMGSGSGAGAPVVSAPAQGLGDFLTAIFNAIQKHDWRVLAASALMLVVFLARTYGSKIPTIGPKLATDRGGAALALGLALVGGLANAFASGASYSFSMFADSLIVAVTAAGGFNLVKKLWAPSDVKASAPASPPAPPAA